MQDNDARAKRLRAQVRARHAPCHVCHGEIHYDADHLHPLSFQADHLWQVDNGGPRFDINNLASSHRSCNRERSNKIDDIAIAAAASYGVTLTPNAKPQPPRDPHCAPDGEQCQRCNGTHHGNHNGRTIAFITARDWTATPDNRPPPLTTPPVDSPFAWR